MNENNGTESVLYAVGTRGYSAYEVAVQNGFIGTEQEWLDSLVGPEGPQGQPFDELTPEQKAEITGPQGKSAYEVAVDEGYEGTEEDFVNSYINADNYYNKSHIDSLATEIDNELDLLNSNVEDVREEIETVSSGSPSGTYDTISDLQTSDPDHSKIYVVLEDGKWYYYSSIENNWKPGAIYQATAIGDNTIDYPMFNGTTKNTLNLVSPTYTLADGYVRLNGTINPQTSTEHTSPIELKKNEKITVKSKGAIDSQGNPIMAVISLSNEDGYSPVVINDNNTEHVYEYVADSDCYVVISSVKNVNINPLISKDLTKINNEVNKLTPKINYSLDFDGYVSYVSGIFAANTSYKCTDFLKILPSTIINFTTFNNMVTGSSGSGVCFYDDVKSFISGVQLPVDKKLILNVPSNAKYMRLTVRINNDVTDLSYIDYIESLVTQSTMENERIDFNLSLFTKIGILGDSYASGCFGENSSSTTAPEHYEMSWPSMLQRNYGFTLHNFSIGGLSTRSFISTGRLNTLLNTEKCDLYLLALERNDYNIENRGETGYLGSIEDIDGVALLDYPDTFYGNYGRIIENILTYSPNSKIIMMSGDYVSSNILGTQYNQAMEEIANYYNIPIIKQLDDSYFNSSLYRQNWPSGGHPGAVQYNGMSNAIDRLLNKCLQENTNYFKYTQQID